MLTSTRRRRAATTTTVPRTRAGAEAAAAAEQREAVRARRQKLAGLLAAENEQYANEILAMQETPEDVKARMEARATELKNNRESLPYTNA